MSALPEAHNPLKTKEATIQCSCGILCGPLETYIAHVERQCQAVTDASGPFPADPSGWPSRHFQFLPDLQAVQRGVVARNTFRYSFFLSLKFKPDYDTRALAAALARVPHVCRELKLPETAASTLVALTTSHWKQLSGAVPKSSREFKAKRAYDGDRAEVFPSLAIDALIVLKSDSFSALERIAGHLTSKVVKDFAASKTLTRGFTYGGGRDLTGFVDGTNNYDETLRSTGKLAAASSSDFEGSEDSTSPSSVEAMLGGSHVFAGVFLHNLSAFHKLSTQDKSRAVGRSYGIHRVARGRLDKRVENPRLTKDVSLHGHIFKAWGEMYRQSYPFIELEDSEAQTRETWYAQAAEKESKEFAGGEKGRKGLFFIAFSHNCQELDDALERMCGKWDKARDHLFQFTRCEGGAYLYAPSLTELALVAGLPRHSLYPHTKAYVEIPSGLSKTPSPDMKYSYCPNCDASECFCRYEGSEVEECMGCGRLSLISTRKTEAKGATGPETARERTFEQTTVTDQDVNEEEMVANNKDSDSSTNERDVRTRNSDGASLISKENKAINDRTVEEQGTKSIKPMLMPLDH